jgi:hypothetical protein
MPIAGVGVVYAAAGGVFGVVGGDGIAFCAGTACMASMGVPEKGLAGQGSGVLEDWALGWWAIVWVLFAPAARLPVFQLCRRRRRRRQLRPIEVDQLHLRAEVR